MAGDEAVAFDGDGRACVAGRWRRRSWRCTRWCKVHAVEGMMERPDGAPQPWESEGRWAAARGDKTASATILVLRLWAIDSGVSPRIKLRT